MASLIDRVKKLEQRQAKRLAPWHLEMTPHPSVDALRARLGDLLDAAMPLFEDKDFQRFTDDYVPPPRPWKRWLDRLWHGDCRLPMIAPELMKDLRLTWASPDCSGEGITCEQCGLFLPRVKQWTCWDPPAKDRLPGQTQPPEFFPNCPHCGAVAKNAEWVRSQHYPWMDEGGYI